MSSPTYRFSLNAHISMARNSFPITLQAKNNTKVLTLSLREPKYLTVHCVPTNQVFFEFDVSTIKSVHSKYIKEGKLTLTIKQGVVPMKFNTLAMSMDGPPIQQILVQIIISDALPQSLEILIQKIKESIERLKPKPRELNSLKLKTQENTKSSLNRDSKLEKQKVTLSKPAPQRFSRKQMLKSALQDDKKLPPKQLKILKPELKSQQQRKKKSTNYFDSLSIDTLMIIFSFSKLNLQYRLLSKQCSQFVMRGFQKLILKPDIPQETFQKLTKFCLKISCRMRNIKQIGHFVNNSLEGPFLPTNTKWLDFSEWKEIKNKNINQLVGLRIYQLCLNYHASICSASLKNLRVTWLSLTGNRDDRNFDIKDEDILQMINELPELTRLQIVCFNGDLLGQISDKKKMKLLKIDKMDIGKGFNWQFLKEFSSLEVLEIYNIWSHPREKYLECSQCIQFPNNIITLKLGNYYNITYMNMLPQSIQILTLANQNVKNYHIHDMVLPKLKKFDVSKCPLVSPQGFESYSNLKLVVRWDDFVIQSIKKQLQFRAINIVNLGK